MQSKTTEKLYSLDVLRGLAAISVVFWHWQHFFYVGSAPNGLIYEKQPLFNLFWVLYKHGDLAVELFFCISGFIFYWLYSGNIKNKKESARNFFIKRFSRLYPLYLLTFLVVAFLQHVYHKTNNSYFVYQFNDFYHAFLNIFMASGWGFESGWSFNAPVWSVSIEALLYALFFITCKTRISGKITIPLFIAIGLLTFPHNYKLGIGIFSFYCGAATFFLSKSISSKLHLLPATMISTSLLCISWIIIICQTKNNAFITTGFGFTSLILFLTTIDKFEKCHMFFKKIGWVGDISYSSYLIHFPLQITFALTAQKIGLSRDIFYTDGVFITFMSSLLSLSFISYFYFETKSQRAIRKLTLQH
ncbi:acyltransferase family protein [Klebsiella variicola]|uniref:acyltransferase family protein n=1 Tax=Klebsiella variicola TaxID=244366 RepID=UPI003EB704A5